VHADWRHLANATEPPCSAAMRASAKLFWTLVELGDWSDEHVYAEYSAFTVADAADNYRVNYDAFVAGDAGNVG